MKPLRTPGTVVAANAPVESSHGYVSKGDRLTRPSAIPMVARKDLPQSPCRIHVPGEGRS